MRYSDSLLTEGENVVLRTRQHWLALLVRARSGIALFIAGLILIALVAVAKNVFPDRTVQQTVAAGLGLVFLILGVVIIVLRWWQWSNQDYVVTNRRLLKVTGIFSKHSADSSLEKINDAILDQSMLGRMMNYGDLSILTAAEEAVDLYHMLNNPVLFKKTMLTQKHALETEFMYPGAMPPTPPLRAGDEMQPHPPTQPQSPTQPQPAMQAGQAWQSSAQMPATPPAAAMHLPDPPTMMPGETVPSPAAAPAAAGDSSLEVTQTLARLADLRDSGAITAEEYDAKKQELLSRL